MGLGGDTSKAVVRTIMMNHPDIYGKYPLYVTDEHMCALRSLTNVSNWLMNGAKRVFLQDANALAMKPGLLSQILQYLKESFPTVDTITCYARSKTFMRRTFKELSELKEAGLSWCFAGIESGCDDVLDYMKKGVTQKEHIEGCQKAIAAGLHIAAFVMPGLSGNDKAMSREHISDTIGVLNEVRLDEVRVRSLAVLEDAPLYVRWESGEFMPPTEDQMIEELQRLINGLVFDCTFETLQMTNPLFNITGRLSQTKEAMQKRIDRYRALSSLDRAHFLLSKYTEGGYLNCVKAWGKCDSDLEGMIEDAEISISEGFDDAREKTERAIFAIKSKGVP